MPAPCDPMRPVPEAASDRRVGIWPVDPDPAVTNLPDRQFWHLAHDRPVRVEVAGIPIPADDVRIPHLGIRRNAAGRAYPARFARCPETGAALGPAGPAPDPGCLDVDPETATEIALPGGVPALLRAGRPAGLYVLQENLGALEAWDGRTFSAMGRLPPAGVAASPAAGPRGLAYAGREALVVVPLPQLGPDLLHRQAGSPGLSFVSAPAWIGPDVLAIGAREGRMVLCRWAEGTLIEQDLAPLAPDAGRFGGPWANRLGDAVWTYADGFVACRSGARDAHVTRWPAGFRAIPSLEPWRDRADVRHQIGMLDGRYHVAALESGAALHRLDGPHCAAGDATYAGAERFDVPWQAPAEALNLGPHAGSLLVPLLAMPRDTVLLALDIPGPRAGFLRGEDLAAPARGHVLHHAHGAGLRRLPVSLEVTRLRDAGALLHDGALYLWSRSARRCHALRLRA